MAAETKHTHGIRSQHSALILNMGCQFEVCMGIEILVFCLKIKSVVRFIQVGKYQNCLFDYVVQGKKSWNWLIYVKKKKKHTHSTHTSSALDEIESGNIHDDGEKKSVQRLP